MRQKYLSLLFYITLTLFFKITQSHSIKKYSLRMPNVRPNTPELYLCTPVKINSTNTYYVVGFEPKATMNVAHHMLLFGCAEPGSSKPIWNCGEMSRETMKNDLPLAGPCRDGSEIIYAWARDAPELILPEDVGFKVGGNSAIKYLVLQVHYAHVDHFRDGNTDDSGVSLHYTLKPLTKLAGVYLLGTRGEIAPMSVEYMESACNLNENKTLHPFAYRVHTHSLGKVVSGYVIKSGDRWIELGKRDPMTPQMFYSVHNEVTIEPGDLLAARCTMKSDRETITYIGATNTDEMCNFYLMYYVENGEPLNAKYCFTAGPPHFHWNLMNLQNIPDMEASTL